MSTQEKRSEIIRGMGIICIFLVCVAIATGLVAYGRYDYNQRETQKATGEFSGYVTYIEPILQNGTTISVSITIRVGDTDPEIIVLGPEFASLPEFALLELTGCTKNPKGFWENCQVKNIK